MKMILIILACSLVGAVLILVIAFYWIKRKIKQFAGALGEFAAGLGAGVPPFRITLEKTTEAEWKDGKTITAASEALVALGYVEIADYDIPEMDVVTLRGFVNAAEQTYFALYEHEQTPCRCCRASGCRHRVPECDGAGRSVCQVPQYWNHD